MRFARLISLLAGLFAALNLAAQYRDDQFKRDAFSQTYADTTEKVTTDSSKIFSFREYIGGLSHKRTASLRTLTIGSTFFPGGMQIYNKQYWKLPIVYAGIGTGVGLGIHYNVLYQQTADEKFRSYRTLAFAGAGLTLWGSLLDGAINYHGGDRHPDPIKSTFYSLLLPGMGQIYNGEAWKLPIYYGIMAGSIHFIVDNNVQYNRWKNIYNLASDSSVTEKPPQSAETAKYYRDVYRRYRDYSLLALALSYVIQIIDANVFAYMQDFEVNEDISMHLEPSIIPQYASAPAVGMSLGFRF